MFLTKLKNDYQDANQFLKTCGLTDLQLDKIKDNFTETYV